MQVDELISEVLALSPHEKEQVLDAIFLDLDKRESEIVNAWAKEAHRRWALYKAGQLRTISYEEVLVQYKRRIS